MEFRGAQQIGTRVADVGDGATARVDLSEPGLALQGVVDDLALHAFQRTWSAVPVPRYGPLRWEYRDDGSDAVTAVTAMPQERRTTRHVDPMWTQNISVRYIHHHIGARCRAELSDRRPY